MRDSGATRDALLAAGLELFADRGYDGAKVDEIAERARVNKAMIHYHFGSKQGLYRAILDETLGRLAGRLEHLRESDLPAPARLARFIEMFGELHLAHPRLSAMMLGEILAGGPRLTDDLLRRLVTVFGTVEAIVAAGVADGSFRRVDPLLTHLTMMLALVAFFATTPFRRRVIETFGVPGGAQATGEAFVAHLKTLMDRGLARGASEPEN